MPTMNVREMKSNVLTGNRRGMKLGTKNLQAPPLLMSTRARASFQVAPQGILRVSEM